MQYSMLYEEKGELSTETLDMKRAIDSLREEFKAVDLYRQRADATSDKNLKGVLLHNMNEELEHASMLLEWIRQHNPTLSDELKKHLFTDTSDIAGKEKMSG